MPFLTLILPGKARPLNRLYRLIWRIPLTSRFSLPILPLCPRSWPSGQRPPYDQNPLFPEQRIHKCASGHLVRSKSEAIIDMVLYTNQVPFRYECALTLGKTVIYPDFTIRDPSSGKTYYWEHFGMMDQPSYAARTFSKLQLYTSFQIIPSIQLITTYETQEHPLNTETAEALVRQYFL